MTEAPGLPGRAHSHLQGDRTDGQERLPLTAGRSGAAQNHRERQRASWPRTPGSPVSHLDLGLDEGGSRLRPQSKGYEADEPKL